ncbi:MAG: hypothetical protein SFV23_23200 [Planctomycetaceae bacterium]|nr:hypothetical protein [Planctomycetaceae bacterium]
MIPLRRVRSEAAIPRAFRGPERIENERKLLLDRRRLLKQEISKQEFDASRWKSAKEQLLRESHGKCAYCEAPTSVVAFGDVEHYRPKSIYWWLAYNYENYLASCALCNEKFKKDEFPIKNSSKRLKGPKVTAATTDAKISTLAGTAGPDSLVPGQVAAFATKHAAERPLLLNPYFDVPAQLLAWRADDNLKTVELVALPNHPQSKAVVDAAIQFYGLNRQELTELRYQQYVTFRTFKQVAAVGTLPNQLQTEVANRILQLQDDHSAFAGMLRFFNAQPGFP